MIAIIAILAAILFPVFARARENARRSSCQSQLKQIGLGLIQYQQDYDETNARSWMDDLGTTPVYPGSSRWMDDVQPYIKSTQVFNCPSATTAPYKPYDGTKPGSYSINSTYYDGTAHSPDGAKISLIGAPATTLWVMDSDPSGLGSTGNTGFLISWKDVAGQPANLVSTTSPQTFGNSATDNVWVARHLDFANALFCDGHVKSLRMDKILVKAAAGTPTAGAYSLLTVEDD